jgi:hypothetical protein
VSEVAYVSRFELPPYLLAVWWPVTVLRLLKLATNGAGIRFGSDRTFTTL